MNWKTLIELGQAQLTVPGLGEVSLKKLSSSLKTELDSPVLQSVVFVKKVSPLRSSRREASV